MYICTYMYLLIIIHLVAPRDVVFCVAALDFHCSNVLETALKDVSVRRRLASALGLADVPSFTSGKDGDDPLHAEAKAAMCDIMYIDR